MSGINKQTLDVIVEAVSRVVTKRLDVRFDEIVKRIDAAEKIVIDTGEKVQKSTDKVDMDSIKVTAMEVLVSDTMGRIEGVETRQAEVIKRIDFGEKSNIGMVEDVRKLEIDLAGAYSSLESCKSASHDIGDRIEGVETRQDDALNKIDELAGVIEESRKTLDAELLETLAELTTDINKEIDGLRILTVGTAERVDKVEAGTLETIEGEAKVARRYFTEEVENVRDKIQRVVAKTQSDIEESHADASQLALELVKGNWQDTVALVEKQGTEGYLRVVDRLEEFRRASPGITDAKAWVEGNRHDIGTTVRHKSGLWHCLKSTCEEPGEVDGEWVCLSTAICEIKVLDQHPNGTRATLGIYDSLGKEHRLSFDLPTFNFDAGTWLERGKYKQLDSVLLDGMRWVATKDNPQGQPGDSDDWVVLAMRGPAGKKGSTGRPGERGEVGPGGPAPDSETVESAVNNVFPIKAGNAIRAWRGNWQYGEKAYAGDLFMFKESFYLATLDSDGSTVPDITGSYWEALG